MKKIFFTLSVLALLLASIACAPFVVGNCANDPSGTTVVDYVASQQSQQCRYKAAAPADGSPQAVPTEKYVRVYDPTPVPAPQQQEQQSQPTAAPDLQKQVVNTICGASLPNFADYVGHVYDAIAKLDAQKSKVPQPETNFTFDGAQGCTLYWTGAYTQRRVEGLKPVLVDGQTGIFLVESGTVVTVNFVGAYAPIDQIDLNAEVVVSNPLPSGCLPTGKVVEMLNSIRDSDPEKVFRTLDAWTNVEGAEYLPARYRPNPLGPAVYENLKPAQTIWWLKPGSVKQPVVELAKSNGKVLVLATEAGKYEFTYAHTGAQLCEPMSPQSQLRYWPGYKGQ